MIVIKMDEKRINPKKGLYFCFLERMIYGESEKWRRKKTERHWIYFVDLPATKMKLKKRIKWKKKLEFFLWNEWMNEFLLKKIMINFHKPFLFRMGGKETWINKFNNTVPVKWDISFFVVLFHIKHFFLNVDGQIWWIIFSFFLAWMKVKKEHIIIFGTVIIITNK